MESLIADFVQVSKVILKLVRQLVHSVSDDNDVVPFLLWYRESMLKGKKMSKYAVNGCQKNFIRIPISVRIHENSCSCFRRVKYFQKFSATAI